MTPIASRTSTLGGPARSIAACVLIGSLAGCASPILRSTYVGENGDVATGLVYSLPKAQLQLVALRKQINGDDVANAIKTAADTAAAFEAATLREAEAKSRVKDASDIEAAADSSKAEAKAELSKQAVIAQAWLAVASNRRKAARGSADAAVKDRDMTVGNLGKWVQSAALKFLPSIPDAAARFVAVAPDHGARDTAVKIGVANGLLGSSSATSTDQAATVLLNLVSASAAKGGKSATLSTQVHPNATLPSGKSPECTPFHLTTTFDPTDVVEVQRAAYELQAKSGRALDLLVDGVGCEIANGACKAATWNPARNPVDLKRSLDGYAYRAARSVNARVESKVTAGGCSASSGAVSEPASGVVPDSTTAFVLPAVAGAFVKTKVEVAFKDGMPLDFSLDAPSQLAAISGLPLAILKAMIEVPASIIKLRVDYESQSLALSDARLKLLKSQLDLQKAQEAIDAEKD